MSLLKLLLSMLVVAMGTAAATDTTALGRLLSHVNDTDGAMLTTSDLHELLEETVEQLRCAEEEPGSTCQVHIR